MREFEIGGVKIIEEDIDALKAAMIDGHIDLALHDRAKAAKVMNDIIHGRPILIKCDGEIIGWFSS